MDGRGSTYRTVGIGAACGEDQVMIRIRRMEKEKLCPYREARHCGRGQWILASLYLPECAQTVPAVALSHGYNGKGADSRKKRCTLHHTELRPVHLISVVEVPDQR